MCGRKLRVIGWYVADEFAEATCVVTQAVRVVGVDQPLVTRMNPSYFQVPPTRSQRSQNEYRFMMT